MAEYLHLRCAVALAAGGIGAVMALASNVALEVEVALAFPVGASEWRIESAEDV